MAKKPAKAQAPPEFESYFEQWCFENLVIQHRETQRFVPFRFNPIQRRLWAIISDQAEAKRRIRIIVLKARKEGVSTLIQAIGYYRTATSKGTHSLVMAHETASSQAIFDIARVFHEAYSSKAPAKKNLSKKEIVFAAPHLSWHKVNTAGTKHFGSGATIHLLHLSELAKWKPSVVNDLLVSVLNAVPDASDTAMFVESTAKGAAGAFYDLWQKAKSGNSEFLPVFFSWLEDPEYRDRGAKLTDAPYCNVPVEWTEAEEGLRRLGADEEQLCWRRRIIGERCQGVPDIFCEEMPATPEEAFLSTGSPVFPASICRENMEAAVEVLGKRPPQRFKVDFDASWDVDAAFASDSRGELHVWERPVRGKHYLIAADVARGIQVNLETKTEKPRLDYSAAYVFDRVPRLDEKTGRSVYHILAAWHGRVDPDRFGAILAHLGKWYGNAILCPEANNYGVTTIQRLLQMHYGNVFLKEKFDLPTWSPIQQVTVNAMQYGWRTGTHGPKWIMAATLNQMIRDRQIHCPDPDFWAETLTFERLPDGDLAARSGCHDDRIMAAAIAVMLLTRHPPSIAVPKKAIKPDTEEYFEAMAEMRRPTPTGVFYLT